MNENQFRKINEGKEKRKWAKRKLKQNGTHNYKIRPRCDLLIFTAVLCTVLYMQYMHAKSNKAQVYEMFH